MSDQITITDFLLARIAEDEAVARSGDGGLMEGAHFSAVRVLAECEAKRRIVSVCRVPDPHTAEEAGEGCTECAVLYTLALPYSDHPDYQPEWRP